MDKRKLKKKTLSVISKLYVILIFLFFYAPVVVMVVFSFNDSRAKCGMARIYNKMVHKAVSGHGTLDGIW